jgi:hypothetical protein
MVKDGQQAGAHLDRATIQELIDRHAVIRPPVVDDLPKPMPDPS